jgi:peptide/nickel transport system substrate-binding protein
MKIRFSCCFALFLIACAPMPVPTAPGDTRNPPATLTRTISTPTPEAPIGGSVTVGAVGSMDLAANALPQFLQDALYDSLFEPDPKDGSLKPALAQSYEVNANATQYTFHLRDGVHWHNGDMLNSDDVAATINAYNNPNFRGINLIDLGPFMRAAAIDPLTVQVLFTESYCPALTYISTMKILPRVVAESAGFPRLTPEKLIGTGPLRLASRGDDRFELVRNDDYFRGASALDKITLRMFSDVKKLRAAFQAGEVDVMTAEAGTYGSIKNLAGAKIYPVSAPQAVMLLFNLEDARFADVRVRQALTYALNRQIFLNDFGGQATLVNSSTVPGFWAAPTDGAAYGYDVNKSKQLLVDAGWRDTGDGILKKNNRPLSVELWTEADDPVLEPLAFRIREMFAAVGAPTELQLDDHSGWVTRAFQHRFDVLLLVRNIPLDFDQRWYWQTDQNTKGSGFNFGSYSNSRVDALMRDGTRTAGCDVRARASSFADAMKQIVSDAPAAFLIAPKRFVVARERVVNLAPSTFAGDFWNIEQWRAKAK